MEVSTTHKQIMTTDVKIKVFLRYNNKIIDPKWKYINEHQFVFQFWIHSVAINIDYRSLNFPKCETFEFRRGSINRVPGDWWWVAVQTPLEERWAGGRGEAGGSPAIFRERRLLMTNWPYIRKKDRSAVNYFVLTKFPKGMPRLRQWVVKSILVLIIYFWSFPT